MLQAWNSIFNSDELSELLEQCEQNSEEYLQYNLNSILMFPLKVRKNLLQA